MHTRAQLKLRSFSRSVTLVMVLIAPHAAATDAPGADSSAVPDEPDTSGSPATNETAAPVTPVTVESAPTKASPMEDDEGRREAAVDDKAQPAAGGARQNEETFLIPEDGDDFLAPLADASTPLPAPERTDDGGHAERLQNGGPPHFSIGVSPAYAFRLHDDARSHGGGAHVYVDGPLFWGFGFQLQAYGWGWGPTKEADRPLGLTGIAPMLIYSFDDSGIAAIAGVGPTLAAGFELDDAGGFPWAPFAGGLFQFGLRFPLGTSTNVDVGIRVPIYVYGPEGFTLRSPFGDDRSQAGFFPAQVSLGVGVTFEPLAFIDAIRIDEDPFGGTLPHELFSFFF